MKIRFNQPKEDFPFFHNVRVELEDGWHPVIAYNDRIGGKENAIFPNKQEMIAAVKRLVKER